MFGIQLQSKRQWFNMLVNPKLTMTETDSLDWEVTDPNAKTRRYRAMQNTINHGKKLGKQFIWNQITTVGELRYAKMVFGIYLNPLPMTEHKNLEIPIPFMKKDHFLITRFNIS